jgi:hypothetical protein
MRSPSTTFRRAAAGALLAALAGPALAQEQEGPPSPEEVKKKVIEIERLMREAEDSLARSLDASSAEAKARRAAKLLDEKARETTGKSAEELRKLAESGAKDAAETLKKLTEEAERKASEATEGVRKFLEETKSGASGASRGIQWVLEKAVRQGQPQQSQQQPQQPKGEGEGEKPQKKPDGGKDEKDPKDREKSKEPPPESPREKPRSPKGEKWLANLPPQVRKMYEAQDWDSIPAQYKDLIRQWSKLMAEDLEKERK